MFGAKDRASLRWLEVIVLIHLFLWLKRALDRAETSRRDAYLASASDIVELERRMRAMDAEA
jgi:hypothetical protein